MGLKLDKNYSSGFLFYLPFSFFALRFSQLYLSTCNTQHLAPVKQSKFLVSVPQKSFEKAHKSLKTTEKK